MLALSGLVRSTLLLLTLLLLASCGDAPNSTCQDCDLDSCGFRDESGQLLVFDTGDHAVQAQIVREADGQLAGFSTKYELRGFALLADDQVNCYHQGLEYESSHHNWVDRARVQLPEGTVELKIEYQPVDANDPAGSEWAWRFLLNGPMIEQEVSLQVIEGNPQG